MPACYRTILFDFDYTLADSSAAVVECVNFALRSMALPEAEPAQIRRTIGLSLPEAFLRLAGASQKDRTQEFRRFFRQRSDQVMVDWTELFEFVPGTVRSLHEAGKTLGIVSTKFRCRIEAVLRREGLARRFEVVVGGEDVQEFKPDPQGLLMALSKLECTRREALFVGDSLADAEAAQRAGLDFLAVLSGTTPREDLAAFRPVEILPSVRELPEALLPGSAPPGRTGV